MYSYKQALCMLSPTIERNKSVGVSFLPISIFPNSIKMKAKGGGGIPGEKSTEMLNYYLNGKASNDTT